MEIKPFKGLLPDKSIVTKLVSPPYDVITRNEARKIIAKNPLSFLRITRSDAEFGDEVSEYDERVYKKAREILVDFIEEKVIIPDKFPSFYLISQKKNGRIQNGIYCLVKCEDYENGHIKKHELTRIDKEIDRTRHIFETRANTGPVFLFFKNNGDFKNLINFFQQNAPDFNFMASEVEYKLWKISDEEDIIKFKEYFSEVNSFYIADGHHRAASAVNVWKKAGQERASSYSYFMAVVFPSDEVTTLAYNRVLLKMKMEKDKFLKMISQYFELVRTERVVPQKKGEIGMCLGKEKFLLHFKGKADNVLDGLDVSILHNYIFNKVLGIEDPRNSEDIDFIGGENSEKVILNMIKNNKASAGFFFYPVDIGDLIMVSDMGKVMPPKSTWFDPKLCDGLVTYLLDEV